MTHVTGFFTVSPIRAPATLLPARKLSPDLGRERVTRHPAGRIACMQAPDALTWKRTEEKHYESGRGGWRIRVGKGPSGGWLLALLAPAGDRAHWSVRTMKRGKEIAEHVIPSGERADKVLARALVASGEWKPNRDKDPAQGRPRRSAPPPLMTTTPKVKPCIGCGRLVATGHADGLPYRIDPVPLNVKAQITVAGSAGHLWQLARDDRPAFYTARLARAGLDAPVFASHTCRYVPVSSDVEPRFVAAVGKWAAKHRVPDPVDLVDPAVKLLVVELGAVECEPAPF